MDEEIPVGSSIGPKMEDEFAAGIFVYVFTYHDILQTGNLYLLTGGPAEVDNRPLIERIGDKVTYFICFFLSDN